MPGAWQVEVKLASTLEEAREHISPSKATLDPLPDGVMLRCAVENLGWVARLLASLECDFNVINPPELRDEIRKLAGRLVANVEKRSVGIGSPS
jgi:predicted DNA-binding transcriptional regulator YafY